MQRGILGGTFDPPHVAHLVAGETAYRDLDLDVVSFVTAGAPWQKAGHPVSAAHHRWEMTQRAVAEIDYFDSDDREVHREGWSYTADTLETYPRNEDLVLILGADAAAGIPTWERPEAVLARARVAVMPRPGTSAGAVEDAVGGRLTWLDTPELMVSGTELRRRATAGGSLRFLVTDAVWDYIVEQELYADA